MNLPETGALVWLSYQAHWEHGGDPEVLGEVKFADPEERSFRVRPYKRRGELEVDRFGRVRQLPPVNGEGRERTVGAGATWRPCESEAHRAAAGRGR